MEFKTSTKIDKWCENHRKNGCISHTTAGEQFVFEFLPSGIAECQTVKCLCCGKEFTDYVDWGRTDMQELEKILEEIEMKKKKCLDIVRVEIDPMEITIHREQYKGLRMAEDIIRKHMNDGWIPVEEHPKKDYTAVFAVDKHDYYFVAVYDKEHGYRTNDMGADVDNIVAYCLFNPYRPERSDNHDGE